MKDCFPPGALHLLFLLPGTLFLPIVISLACLLGFPGGSEGKVSAYNAGDPGSIPGLGRSPGEGNGKHTPVFLPGKSHALRSLVGYSPWGRKESDTTEWLHFHFLSGSFLVFGLSWDVISPKKWPPILSKLLSIHPNLHVTSLQHIAFVHFLHGPSHSPNLSHSCICSLLHPQVSTSRESEALSACFPHFLQFLEQRWVHWRGLATWQT